MIGPYVEEISAVFAGVAARWLRRTATFTRLTPGQQPRNADNVYPVEASFDSQQQSLRWDSIQPYVLVNGQRTRRCARCPWSRTAGKAWCRCLPGAAAVNYRFKFDYLYNVWGKRPNPTA